MEIWYTSQGIFECVEEEEYSYLMFREKPVGARLSADSWKVTLELWQRTFSKCQRLLSLSSIESGSLTQIQVVPRITFALSYRLRAFFYVY